MEPKINYMDKVPDWPKFPSKEEMPTLFIRIEAVKANIHKGYVEVFMTDANGGRNFKLPINAKDNDLDASELTWAITRTLREWNDMDS